MIEIEVQNETNQTQNRIRFAAVPRIGEGIRLRDPEGLWASYDVIDVWYQKAEFGDVWMPYLHVRLTPGELGAGELGAELEAELGGEFGDDSHKGESQIYRRAGEFASLGGEAKPFKI